MPCAPFHHWLLVAHVEASTSGSILLAGILLKLPAYAVLRIFHAFGAAVPQTLQGCILAFTLLSVFLCCFKIWGELDLKRIIAISSIVHMNVAIGSLG